MSLQAGQKLGPYEVVEPLGAGGMGEVWRARDTRLDRDVAIKVLPEHLARNEHAQQRLEREARAVSALSHPNICTLFDVGHEGDLYYLVIEYLQGTTLAERLEKGPLTTEEVLRYAIQIADALDKAHRGGVVHRDLKPGNVMITSSGAKLLDFGLAKSVTVPGGSSSLSVAPTATSPLTAEGTIVGTFQYMAPEQLEGTEADERSDIFAFGAMLFEMITGRRAFEGKTQAGLIAAIIEREPPAVSSIQPLAPPALDRLIRTCLAKDPEERRQTIHDVLLDLRWIAEAGSQAGVPAPVTRRRKHRVQLAWATAAICAVVAAGLAWIVVTRPTPQPRRLVTELMMPDDVALLNQGLAVSPDGAHVAFVASRGSEPRHLWLRDLTTGTSRALPGTEDAYAPFWSPDGRSLGFFARGALQRVDVQGGSPLALVELESGGGGSWGRDGMILYSVEFRGGLRRVAASGGESVPVENGERLGAPFLLPGGKRYLCASFDPGSEEYTIRLRSLDGKLDKELGVANNWPAYSNGYVFYLLESSLIAQALDDDRLELTGPRRIIAQGVAEFDVGAGGDVVYLPVRESPGSQITRYDRDGVVRDSLVVPQVLDDLALSADDGSLAMARQNLENKLNRDVWRFDLARKLFTRVTFQDNSDDPVWSPDGNWLIYAVGNELYRIRANGTGKPELLLESTQDPVTHDWSRDGKQVLFSWFGDIGNLDLMALDASEGGQPVPVLDSPFDEFQAQFSPDGRWLAYTSDESGELQVYVRDWPGLERKWQVSTQGGGMPRWRGDSRELFYVSFERTLKAVPLATRGADLEIGVEQVLFSTRIGGPGSRSTDYVVTSDGQSLLFLELPPGTEGRRRHMVLMLDALASAESG